MNEYDMQRALQLSKSADPLRWNTDQYLSTSEALALVFSRVPVSRATLEVQPFMPRDVVYVNGRRVINWNGVHHAKRILVLRYDFYRRLRDTLCLVDYGARRWRVVGGRYVLACMLEAMLNHYSIHQDPKVFIPVIRGDDLHTVIVRVMSLYYGFQAGDFSKYGLVRLADRDITHSNELLGLAEPACTLFLSTNEPDSVWVQLNLVYNQGFWAAGQVYSAHAPAER